MSLQALIFDLGGVIVPFDQGKLFRRLADRCAAEDALQRIVDDNSDHRYATGELPIDHLYGRFVDELGYQGDWEAFRQDFCCHLEIDGAMLDLVERLSRTHRVMLFSNTNQVHWDDLLARTDGLLGRFEPYLSHEIGAVKPHLHAFAVVAERAGVTPGRCLFIDDRMDNVEAARLAGFRSAQFTDQTSLAALLREAGVTWPETAAEETV